ncbi:MAG TPA: glutathione-disulfide reductase [Steroidobacteraceae bacterium]|nr:glutathione-disulfide reductase [Steroidobacteraceae bacterium]
MTQFDYDLFVIGAGSGGVRAARIAAGFGARVAVAEADRPGGTCVIRGCVPKKLLVYAARFREEIEDAAAYGWSADATFSWPTLIANKDREIARLEDIYRTLLKSAGASLYEGRATLVDSHTIEIATRRYTARHVLIATGGRPVRPDIPGAGLAITSDEAFQLAELPCRVLIVGGGYVGVEFGGIFHGLGAHVAIAYRGEQILRGFDDDVRHHLHDELVRKGLDVRLHCDLRGIERRADGSLAATLATGGTPQQLEVDAVMFATGRQPVTAGLGLEAAGVQLDANGAVIVDEYSRSSVPSIHAVGDVTNRVALTPVAIREGAAVATTLFGGQRVAMDHREVPHAVFSQPPVGTVGLSEAAAAAAYESVDVYTATFRPLKNTLSGRNERTLVKLVIDAATQRVVGAHMVGPDAPEIIQGIAIAVKAGLTKEQFDATVAVHPTAAEEFVTLRDRRAARR